MQANVLRKQGQAVRPVRQFSNAQMKLYFTEERCPKKAVWIICISGGLAILSACPGFWIFTGLCLLIALIQGAIVGWRLWYIPSDQQYDDWLEENRRVLASRGSKKLHLESKQAIKPYLRVQIHWHGFSPTIVALIYICYPPPSTDPEMAQARRPIIALLTAVRAVSPE